MYDPVFQILFLGENPSWLRVSHALAESPAAPLHLHRSQSPSELFRLLAAHSENKTQAHLKKGSPLMNLAPDDSRRNEHLPAHPLHGISHALNNLLCVISANADVLADRLEGSDPAAHSVAEIKKAAKSAAELMHQIE